MRAAAVGIARLTYEIANCSAYTGPSGNGIGDAPSVDTRQLRHDEADDDEPDDNILERVDELGQIETGQRRDQDDHGECRQRNTQHRSDTEASELHEAGGFHACCGGDVGSQLIEVEVEHLHHRALIDRECGRLEVRQQALDLLGGPVGEHTVDGHLTAGGTQRCHRARVGATVAAWKSRSPSRSSTITRWSSSSCP